MDLIKSDQNSQTTIAPVGTTSAQNAPKPMVESGTDPDKSDQINHTLDVGTPQKTAVATGRKPLVDSTECANVVLPIVESSPVEVPKDINRADDLLLSQYPWTTKLTLCLERVTPLTIVIWTNTVHEYWCYEPAVETETTVSPFSLDPPINTDISGHVLCNRVKQEPKQPIVKTETVSPVPESDTKTADLIKHAESLLERA